MKLSFFILALSISFACAYANSKYQGNDSAVKDKKVLSLVEQLRVSSPSEREELTNKLVLRIRKLQTQTLINDTGPQ